MTIDLDKRITSALTTIADAATADREAIRTRVLAETPTDVPVGARRIVALTAVAVLVVIGLVAISRRPDTAPTATATMPERLSSYAVLTNAGALPVAMRDQAGGQPGGQANSSLPVPRIDVWKKDAATLVVRTVDLKDADSSTGTGPIPSVPADGSGTAEPWGNRPVTLIHIRGVRGAIQTLAADQHAIWIPDTQHGSYTAVVGRGIGATELQSLVESMVDNGGVLEPRADFVAVERHPAVPAGAPVPAYADVTYSFNDGPYVSTTLPPAGHRTIETALRYQIGRLDHIGDRIVLIVDDIDRTFAAWLEPSGELVTVVVIGEGKEMSSLVNATKMVQPHDWEAISRDVSTSIIERLPVLSSMVSDTTTVTYRADTSLQAICVRTTQAPESCAAQPRPDQMTPYISAQTQIGGHWLIFGYHNGSDGGIDATRQNAMTFIDPGGNDSKPDWVRNAAGDWYVTAIPDGVDNVVTNQGEILGGTSGSLFRTFVPSVLL